MNNSQTRISFDNYNYDKPLEFNVDRLEKVLAGVANVKGIQHRLSETFVLLFRETFLDMPYMSNSSPFPNTSNWTHHTYYSIRAAAKALFLSCTFETMGRLDAVIQTIDEYPGVILVAEWETKAFSTFGPGKELEKLWIGANKHPRADALLFTYCPTDQLLSYIKQTVQFWQSQITPRQNPPSLYLTVIATRRVGRDDEFVFLRTLEIASASVGLWHDLGFVDLEDYGQCIEGT